MEGAGAAVDPAEVKEALSWEGVAGLGEGLGKGISWEEKVSVLKSGSRKVPEEEHDCAENSQKYIF